MSWRKAEGVWLRTVTLLGAEEVVEGLGRAADPVGNDDETAAVEESAPEFPDGEVEGIGMKESPDIA